MKYTIDTIREAIYGLDEEFEVEGGKKVPLSTSTTGRPPLLLRL